MNTLQDLVDCVNELRARRLVVENAHTARDEAERKLIAARHAMNQARDDWYQGRQSQNEPMVAARSNLNAADKWNDHTQRELDEALRQQDMWEGMLEGFAHRHMATVARAELESHSHDPEAVASMVDRITRDLLTVLK